MKIEHIYWFAPYDLSCPTTRYRGYYPLKYIRKHKQLKSDFVYPSNTLTGVFKFLRIYLSALLFQKKNSIIVIQKICTNRIYANLLKLLVLVKPKYTHYDIDDAEYLRHHPKTLHFFLKRCSVITVGSLALKEYVSNFNNRIIILTSPVVEHNSRKEARNKRLNIGWVGDFGNGNENSKPFSHKTSMYQILFPVLKEIDASIQLTLIGIKNKTDIPEIRAYFEGHKNIKISIPENLSWENDYWIYDEIQKFDIGVSPMNDHLFNQSKSAFKAKQYLSVGIPTIASDVGENKNFVLHNKNGIICKSNLEFKQAIQRFITMQDREYFEFSNNALNTKQSYAMKMFGETLLQIYDTKIKNK